MKIQKKNFEGGGVGRGRVGGGASGRVRGGASG